MSPIESSNSTLFWNEDLAKNLQRFLTSQLRCAEMAADLNHEIYLRLGKRVSSVFKPDHPN